MAAENTARISPTAHYTGYVWYRHGLGNAALATKAGAAMYHGLRPAFAVYERVFGRRTLETLLLRRHQVMDHILGQAIAAGRISCVVEIAAGLSPRGLRMMDRYQHLGLTYVEGDLAGMATMKRERLDAASLRRPKHHVETLNALADDGPESLLEIARKYCTPNSGIAVITEGLVNYFDRATVEGIWTRIAKVLGTYPKGLYLSDLHVKDETMGMPLMRGFQAALSTFARGGVHFHYDDAQKAQVAVKAAGFESAALHQPAGFAHVLSLPPTGTDVVRIIEAVT